MRNKALLVLVALVLLLTALGGLIAGVTTVIAQAADAAAETEDGLVEPTGTDPVAHDADATEPRPADTEASPRAEEPESLIRHGRTAPPAKTDGAIRLATYNVENLFDDIDDPDLSGRQEDIDDTKPEAHVLALADTIRRLDADILALQEIESESVVRAFRDEHLAGLGYDHLVSIDAGDERGIEQAVLSRFPITSHTNWPRRPLGGMHPDKWGDNDNWNAGEPMTFHRSPLRTTIEIPAESTGVAPYELTLYTVHAKSGRPGEYWRIAEAQGLVRLLREGADEGAGMTPAENIAILGDFNAFASDDSVETYTAFGFIDLLDGTGNRNDETVTHHSGRRIDHILVNPNLANEIVQGSTFVLGTPALPEGIDWRQEWRPDGYASDHYPVAVDIVPVDR